MKKRILVLCLAAVCAFGLAASAFGLSRGERANPQHLLSVSRHGALVTLTSRARAGIERLASPVAVSALRTVATTTFYRIETDSRGTCFGTGRAGTRGAVQRMGVVACSPAFPSRMQPILDLSVFGATRSRPALHLLRMEGFAADQVAMIAARDSRGRIVVRTPVVDNVYSLVQLPRKDLTSVVALDRQGKVMYSVG